MMNILYFGTICDIENYDRLMRKAQYKPSVSTIVFENALLEGFKEHNLAMEIHSFPMIPSFPKSNLIFFGRNIEKLACGYECRWLNTINIPVLKQITRRIDANRILKKWGEKYRGTGIIITYSVPPFLVKDIVSYGRNYSLKTIAIVPDLLRDMYINENKGSFFSFLKNLYIKPALKLQKEYDGYIYLTEDMHKVVAPEKPYIVMEGIANTSIINTQTENKSVEKRAIMYAGMLHEKYGIINLVEAFEQLEIIDVELWLFGSGTASAEIKRRAEMNSRIKYFGTVSRETVLKYEKKATLLVNPRNPDDEFTFYSFPSKTIEYMLSGTPLLTTRLKGIPNDYYEYVFSIENNRTSTLVNKIKEILGYSEEAMAYIGERAKKYIVEEKNAYKQTEKIIEFLIEVTDGI